MAEILWQSLGGLVAVVGFGAFMNVPRRFLLWAGIDGAVGWMIYLLINTSASSIPAATFFSAVAISLGAHICARIFCAPVTMFLIPANMTLVPGAGMYRIVYSIIRPGHGMPSYHFKETLLTAGIIAAAIFIVNILVGAVKKHSPK